MNASNPLIALLETRLSPLAAELLQVADDSAQHAGHAGNTGGGHLSAKIVSNFFSGLSTVARHRAVYALVADLMPHTIHALSLTVKTPEEVRMTETGNESNNRK